MGTFCYNKTIRFLHLYMSLVLNACAASDNQAQMYGYSGSIMVAMIMMMIINNNYWVRLSKILGFVSGEQTNNYFYLPKPKAEANK